MNAVSPNTNEFTLHTLYINDIYILATNMSDAYANYDNTHSRLSEELTYLSRPHRIQYSFIRRNIRTATFGYTILWHIAKFITIKIIEWCQ